MDFGATYWIVAAGAVLAVLVASAFRFVPGGQTLVVFRVGRAAGVRGPGLVLVVPGLERVTRVPMERMRLDLLWIKATNQDALTVIVSGAISASVRDPLCYAAAVDFPPSATTAAAEVEIRRHIAGHHLEEIADSADRYHHELASLISDRTSEWGVEVTRVDFDRIHVQLDPSLFRWAESIACRDYREPSTPQS